jgi:hypothetical protein
VDDRGSTRQRVALSKLTPFDVVVIILIVLLAVGIILRNRLNISRQPSEAIEATVYHDGVIHQHLALDKDQEISLLDGKILIEIKEKKIRVKKSECPRQVCVNAGWIRLSGETIICVPYKILIEIKSTGAPLVDAVVF